MAEAVVAEAPKTWFSEFLEERRKPGAVPGGGYLDHIPGDDLSELSAEIHGIGEEMTGAGTELKSMLEVLRIGAGGCSRCSEHAQQMDDRGVEWCDENIEMIVGWLRGEAKRRNWWMYSDLVARQLVRRAIARARDALVREPFQLSGTRHFLYHLAPFAATDIWRRNVDQVLDRLWLFNGKRIVAIVSGEGLSDPGEVVAAFRGEVETFVIPNNSKLREVATFVPLLSQVEAFRDDLTFYGHSKGVTRPVNSGVTVHRWTDMLYETTLDYFPRIQHLLQRYSMVGSFKKVGHGFRGSKSTWHYSGTFYWFRNRDVFSRSWRKIDMQWWGTESWPGLIFRQDEAGCSFYEGRVSTLDMYSMEFVNRKVQPSLEQWRKDHQSERFKQENAA